MPKKKDGTIITWKEFFKEWKKGIDNITPLQKMQNEARGTFITLLGFLVSFVAVIYMRETIGLLAYGLILIFLGSIMTTGLRWLALKQQLKLLKNLTANSLPDLNEVLEDLGTEVEMDDEEKEELGKEFFFENKGGKKT